MVSKGYMIAGIGAVACLLGFFLPWISVFGLTVSGWQATFGYNIGGFNVGGGNFLYVLVLLAPFAVGYLLYNSFKKGGMLDKNLDAYGLIGIGVVVLLLLLVASAGSCASWAPWRLG